MAVKTCTKCTVTKSVEDFRLRQKRGKEYLNSSCRECERTYNRDYMRANPKVVPIWQRHHMTDEQYWKMFNDQNGECANPHCDGDAEVIDHDHTCCPGKRSCGKCVMGLLCASCNTAEGMLRSNANLALGLAEYIIMTRGGTNGLDEDG